jgi:hypothetical protein
MSGAMNRTPDTFSGEAIFVQPALNNSGYSCRLHDKRRLDLIATDCF